jgi:hypothetical protein
MLPYLRANIHGRLLLGCVRQAMLIVRVSVCKAQKTLVPGFGLHAAYQLPRATVAVSDAS